MVRNFNFLFNRKGKCIIKQNIIFQIKLFSFIFFKCDFVMNRNIVKYFNTSKTYISSEQRKIPSDGWTDQTIELLLQELSLMDSNNFPDNCGVGEREARIFSTLVASRHFRLLFIAFYWYNVSLLGFGYCSNQILQLLIYLTSQF